MVVGANPRGEGERLNFRSTLPTDRLRGALSPRFFCSAGRTGLPIQTSGDPGKRQVSTSSLLGHMKRCPGGQPHAQLCYGMRWVGVASGNVFVYWAAQSGRLR